jgi:hypothetical protein
MLSINFVSIFYFYIMFSISFVDEWIRSIFGYVSRPHNMQKQFCFLKLVYFSPGWLVGFTILNWRKTEGEKTRRNGLNRRKSARLIVKVVGDRKTKISRCKVDEHLKF